MPRCPTCHRRILEAAPCPLDGTIAPPSPVPADVAGASPPRVPGFTVETQLGMGGFSIVWKATRDEGAEDGADDKARQRVAIKVGRGDSPNTVERFRRDAEALARIGPPHTPRLFKSGKLDDGRPFIAMELLEGKTLAELLEEMPAPPDLDFVRRVGVGLLDALGTAHARGIMHRDLKPENIFLDEGEHVATLIDFGLTKSVSADAISGITRAGMVVGTPEYMAPEQIRGEAAIDGRADIYAVGVILYELCTLRLPFVGDRGSIEHGHLVLRPPRPTELAPIPEALEELILACLAKDLSRRPQTAQALRRALIDALPMSAMRASSIPPGPIGAEGSRPPPPPGQPGSRPSSSRMRLLVEGRRPMVVLAIETTVAAPQVTAAVTRRSGFIARQRGSTYVSVFSGVDVENPVQAALAAARDVVARFGAKAALHLASLAMRRQENAPPAVYGAPLDRPETWLPPPADWSGIMLTAELARAVPEAELAPAAEGDLFFKLAPMSCEDAGQSLSISGVQLRNSVRGSEAGEASLRRGSGARSKGPASQRGSMTSHSTPGLTPPSTMGPSAQEAGVRSIDPGAETRSARDTVLPASPRGPLSKPKSQPLTQQSPEPPASQKAPVSVRHPPMTLRSPVTSGLTSGSSESPARSGEMAGEGPTSEPQTQPAMSRPRGKDTSGASTPPNTAGSTAPPGASVSVVPVSGTRTLPAGIPRTVSASVATTPPFSGMRTSPPVDSSRTEPPTTVTAPVPLEEFRREPMSTMTAPPPADPRGFGVGPPSTVTAPPPPADLRREPMSTMPAPPYVRRSIAPGLESTIPPRSMPPSDPVSLHGRQPLFGRDDVLSAMEASAAASFDAACPGLFTLIGDSGLGKTRLAAEAASVVDRLRPGLLVFFHRAAQPLADAAGQTTRELLARVLGASSGEAPHDARAFCRLRLGDDLGEEVWPAVALALGWSLSEPLSVTPGALQRGTMLALTEGLRRLSKEGPVALLLDDAHWADDTALDALEYATLNAEGCPLWVMVTAHPRFENVRRTWGSRAQRHDRVVLGPLEEEPAMRLAAELLLPAEYPPAATLKRLSEWAGFNPACLAELARTLKRAGIVRQRPNLGTWYVATAELDRLPPSPAWQWLAVRQLDALQPEFASCVRLCSVFGVEFSRAEVERVQDAMERAGIAGTTIDMGVGLSALVEKRVLVRGSGDRYLFQSQTFQDAVYKLLDAGHREKIHRHAFEYWRSRLLAAAKGRVPETTVGEGALASIERGFTRLARHAGACGEREQAADAYLTLGDSARARHKHVEADQYYTAALGYINEGDPKRRARALAGRGKVRYRVHRIREALEDLKAARELSEALGDDALRADMLLEEATALDFAGDFAESAIRAEQARPLIEGHTDRHFELRLLAALGRSAYRHGRTNEAADLLARAADGAKELNDYETRVIAILLLAPVLVSIGNLEEAENRFDEVLALCTTAEDWLHLSAAYANRAAIWIARKRLEQATDDLRRAIQLAREVGNPRSESNATYNVAEFLHWLGDEEEALILARRGRVLEERFNDRPDAVSSLLLARIQAARGDFDEVRQLVEWIAQSCPPDASDPVVEAYFAMLQLVLLDMGEVPRIASPTPLRWDDLTTKASGGSFTEELLEVLYWRAKTAIRCERWEEADASLKEAQQRLDECPMWRLRFADLMSRSLLRQPTSIPVDSRTVVS